MNRYTKPLIFIETLYSNASIAVDDSTLGEIDPSKEISIPIGGNWGELLDGD